MQCKFSTFVPQRVQPEASPSLWDDNGFSRALFTLSLSSLLRCLSHWVLSPAVSLQYFPVDCSVPFNFLRLKFIHAAKLLQSCPTLCDPIDGSPAGSPIPGILQARTLEWVAISFSNAWKWKVNVKSLSHVRLFATPWTAAYQAPPSSMGFSRQDYWSGLPLPFLKFIHSPILIFSFSAGVTFEDGLCSLLAPKKGFSNLSLFLVFSGKPGSLTLFIIVTELLASSWWFTTQISTDFCNSITLEFLHILFQIKSVSMEIFILVASLFPLTDLWAFS